VKRVTIPAFASRLARLNKDLEAAVVRGLQSAIMVLDGFVLQEIDDAKPFPAVDRGILRNSRNITRTAKGATHSVDAPHAPMIEDGTRPFRPPVRPIFEWVLRKGITDDEGEAWGIAFAIARKFEEQGMKPRHFYRKAWKRLLNGKHVEREIARELDKLASRSA
jgi:hypothetical protein